jgi:hypothetical protein
MQYSIQKSIEILERTPTVLKILLSNLSDEWIMSNEGPETFSPYDVIGHLIHGEKTDWTARAKIILEFGLYLVTGLLNLTKAKEKHCSNC